MLGLYTTGPQQFQASCNLDIVAKIGKWGKGDVVYENIRNILEYS